MNDQESIFQFYLSPIVFTIYGRKFETDQYSVNWSFLKSEPKFGKIQILFLIRIEHIGTWEDGGLGGS